MATKHYSLQIFILANVSLEPGPSKFLGAAGVIIGFKMVFQIHGCISSTKNVGFYSTKNFLLFCSPLLPLYLKVGKWIKIVAQVSSRLLNVALTNVKLNPTSRFYYLDKFMDVERCVNTTKIGSMLTRGWVNVDMEMVIVLHKGEPCPQTLRGLLRCKYGLTSSKKYECAWYNKVGL